MNQIQKIGATAFILNSEGRVLIVKRSADDSFMPGYFELPGGKVEFGESAEDALIREIKEEVDLEIEIIKPYSTFSYTSTEYNKHTIDIQYFVKTISDFNSIKLSKEHDGYKWITASEIDDYEFSDEMRVAIIKGFEIINN